MKELKLPLLSIALLIGFSAEGQVRPKFKDWFFYDVSHVQYLNAPTHLKQAWYSNGHSISILGQSSFGQYFAIGYGLGYQSENFHNNLRITTQEVTGEEIYRQIPDSSFTSNRQNFGYLFVPIELRFKAKANNKGQFLRLYLGAKLGVRVRSYAEYETEVLKQRFYNLEDVARFRADAYVRLGFDNLSLYASYGLTELYQAGQAINSVNGAIELNDLNAIRPLALGISISL